MKHHIRVFRRPNRDSKCANYGGWEALLSCSHTSPALRGCWCRCTALVKTHPQPHMGLQPYSLCKVISSTNTHLHKHPHTCTPEHTHTYTHTLTHRQANTHSKLGKASRHLWAHEAAVQLVCSVSALAWCISIHKAITLTLEPGMSPVCVRVCVYACV